MEVISDSDRHALAVGARIRELRTDRGWTQEDLLALLHGKGLNTSRETLSKWENGRSLPYASTMGMVASLLGTTMDYLNGDGSARWPDKSEGGRRPIKWIPIVGIIAAGVPLYAETNIEEQFTIPAGLDVQFALKVKGDSMIGANIFNGSIVLCREQSEVENGQIAVCIVDAEEATLKRVFRHDGIVVLRADNPTFHDIIFSAKEAKQLRIIGRAIMVVTTL